MSEKTLHIVQQFETAGKAKKLVAGRAIQAKSEAEAIARAERDATRFPAVVAVATTVDTDTGEVLEEPRVLFRHGALPAEFADSSAF